MTTPEAEVREALEATPKQIAAAWYTWKSRHGGKLGPGPAFVEAINAALNADDRFTSLRDERERLREALEPFAVDWADEHGWTDNACQKDRIVDWFGPSDFRAARALIQETSKCEQQ